MYLKTLDFHSMPMVAETKIVHFDRCT